MFKVGPESVGAHPGPVCYRCLEMINLMKVINSFRKGGELAITDANLLLGRLLPKYFPKIFGEKEDQELDIEVTQKAFERITKEVNDHNRKTEGENYKEVGHYNK